MVNQGGMSRASKKRAKKKQKKSISNDGDDINNKKKDNSIDGNNSDSKQRLEQGDVDHSEIGEPKPIQACEEEEIDDPFPNESKMKFAEEAEEDHVDEQHDTDDDESSENKPANKRKKPDLSATESQVLPPKDCHSLVDLINEDALSPALDGMTVRERANCVLNFLLQPAGITAREFHSDNWERAALLVQQSSSTHRHRFDGLLSLSQIRQMLYQKDMRYGRDLNVTRYELDKHGVKRRVTLDLVKPSQSKRNADTEEEIMKAEDFVEVDPDVVWTRYNQGCTIRLLCPHVHSNSIHALLHLLELEWGCMVGANAYLTPPGSSQGFAPHYDDIEAFCLQLEGKKRWKVYPPIHKAETLPRKSSPDYTEEDLKGIEPVMDVVLSPGDVLYMPRGWIHQACTLPDGQREDGHSLHLTVSAMQQWAWVDLFEILLPEALNAAAASTTSVALREGLPVRFLDYMGAAHANREVPELLKKKMDEVEGKPNSQELRLQKLQDDFRKEAKMRIMRVAKEAIDLLDASCDQISKQFMSARQPPSLGRNEIKATSAGQTTAVKILPNTIVRLVRPGLARLVLEDDKAVVYHCLDNSRVYHERPLQPLEFELDDGPALEQLLATCEPHWICAEDLFHDTIEDKVGVTQALYDEGLLMIKQ